jgi:hypothetical protein
LIVIWINLYRSSLAALTTKDKLPVRFFIHFLQAAICIRDFCRKKQTLSVLKIATYAGQYSAGSIRQKTCLTCFRGAHLQGILIKYSAHVCTNYLPLVKKAMESKMNFYNSNLNAVGC